MSDISDISILQLFKLCQDNEWQEEIESLVTIFDNPSVKALLSATPMQSEQVHACREVAQKRLSNWVDQVLIKHIPLTLEQVAAYHPSMEDD
jgi:hypothetical protein